MRRKDWLRIEVETPPEQWQEEVQGYRSLGSVDDEIEVGVKVRVRIEIAS